MTKNELASKVAEETGLSGAQAKQAVETTLDLITKELSNRGEVNLAGFGKFSTRDRPERQGKNPATGEAMTIKASTAAKFSPATALKNAVNS
jgi:nucleoid DNA-binding protein